MSALRKSTAAQEIELSDESHLAQRLESRRNALVGLWAATVLDLDDQEAYSTQLSELAGSGDAVLLERLRDDFNAAGIPVMDEVLQDRLVALLESAAQDLRARK